MPPIINRLILWHYVGAQSPGRKEGGFSAKIVIAQGTGLLHKM